MRYTADNIRIDAMKLTEKNAREMIEKKLHIENLKIKNFEILKKSLDSRFYKSKGIFYVYSVAFDCESRIKSKDIKPSNVLPLKDLNLKKTGLSSPLIVGSGPSGLFCALRLVECGVTPIILEAGSDLEEREKDINSFFSENKLNESSNIHFGLGGAGTYSDGKLRTRIKTPLTGYVLNQFVKYGADKSILYDAKPHLGTDKLSLIVTNIKQHLIEKGASFRFNSRLSDIIVSNGKIVCAVVNDKEEIACSDVILCIGNSARKTFKMLETVGTDIKPKPIAVGFRIEHPQPVIDKYIYGDYIKTGKLPPAEYQLKFSDVSKRSVYSFCNCPGGVVINSSTENGMLSVNGMSYSKRNEPNANSALVVTVKSEDYLWDTPLAGVEFQRKIENAAFEKGGANYASPVMSVSDYIGGSGKSTCVPTVKPGFYYTDINELLPKELNQPLKNAITYFCQRINGFDGGMLTACETKTSSPIRILRKTETHESTNISGLFPTGEGAGYAGGIVSSAVDGVISANMVMEKYRS